MYQYLPSLESAGFDVTVRPLSDDTYLETLYGTGRRQLSQLIVSYANRLKTLRSNKVYDLIWIEKEVFPFVPGKLEIWSMPRRTPYVLDYDDATFHRYDEHPSNWIKFLLGSKLKPIQRGATAITAGNPYLAAYAKRAGARNIVTVPTVVDLDRYPDTEPPRKTNELRICWIGSPSTTPYLKLVQYPLEELARTIAVRLVTIGTGERLDMQIPIEQHPWSEETEAALLSGCHLGIMPLPDAPWERGKCGYKLIQYMACSLPVAASPVGVNQDIVTSDVGFLCAGDNDWFKALQSLASNAAMRRQLGQAGRRAVEERYSLQAQAPIVIDVLRTAMEASR